MSEPGFLDDDLDDVRDSQGRRIDSSYVARAGADVRARRGRPRLSLDPDQDQRFGTLRCGLTQPTAPKMILPGTGHQAIDVLRFGESRTVQLGRASAYDLCSPP